MNIKIIREEFGDPVFYTIVKNVKKLCRAGLYREDEREDLYQEFYLDCLQAINRSDFPQEKKFQYLVTCIKHKSMALKYHRERENKIFVLFTDAVGKTVNTSDKNQWPLEAKAILEEIDPILLLECNEVLQAIEKLKEPHRSFIEYMLQTGCSQRRACEHFNKNHMYFNRHVLPALRKAFGFSPLHF